MSANIIFKIKTDSAAFGDNSISNVASASMFSKLA